MNYAKFSSAGLVEQLIWNARMADLPRGSNRAQIERLANGNPPYTRKEKEEHRIDTNVNFLEMPEFLADARRSIYHAFLSPGIFFTVNLDTGNPNKRTEWGGIITREMNKRMKASKKYLHYMLGQGAMEVLHGIAPGVWRDKDHWCPKIVGIEDVLIPVDTETDLENLPYLPIFRQFTAEELYRATTGPNVDSGWNMPLVKQALEWAKGQWWKERSYSDLYAPQKLESLYKQDLGFMGTDAVPTIDAWDFYYWDDSNGEEGWRRKMILDTPPAANVYNRNYKTPPKKKMPSENLIGGKHGEWLYNSEDKVYAEKLDSIIHFQFADCSAVAPFKYHSVRSLGWLLYAACHIQNRLRCRIMDAAFENTTQYFRVTNQADHERVLSVQLQNKGEIPEGLNFVRSEERWNPDKELLELAMTQNQERMNAAAAQYREGRNTDTSKKEKTATEIMAEVNAATALVGSMLMQEYAGKKFEYMEIARRFCQKTSADKDVRDFRAAVLKAGVPPEVLDASTWNIEPERVLGSGNKVLQVAMTDKLMQAINLFDPSSQRIILRMFAQANTDNPELAARLVPEEREVSKSVHDGQLMLGTLMQGIVVAPTKGQNFIEIVQTLLTGMGTILTRIKQGLTPPTMQDVVGLETTAATVRQYMTEIAKDKNAKEALKEIGKVFAQVMKEVQMLMKSLHEQQQPQGGNGNGGLDPKDAAKIAATQKMADVKAQNAAISHQQKTVQREVQFNMKMQQDRQRHLADLRKKAQDTKLNAAVTDVKTAAEIKRSRLKSMQE